MNYLNNRLKEVREQPHLLQFYAKSSCKHCNGRGYITRNLLRGAQWRDSQELCQCVIRAIQKESKSLVS